MIWKLIGSVFAMAMLPALALTVLQSRIVLHYLQKPGVRYFYTTTEKVLALTIDDGPDPRTTPVILKVLREYNVKATFFLIGSKVQMYPYLVQQIINDGHQIGNHDYHDFASVLRSKTFAENLDRTHQLLMSYQTPTIFRPGCGFYANWMLDILKPFKYQCILGNIYPHDVAFSWRQFLVNYIVWRASPGSIIILHDGRPKLHTETTLGIIIPVLQRRGYTFATISEMESRYS